MIISPGHKIWHQVKPVYVQHIALVLEELLVQTKQVYDYFTQFIWVYIIGKCVNPIYGLSEFLFIILLLRASEHINHHVGLPLIVTRQPFGYLLIYMY